MIPGWATLPRNAALHGAVLDRQLWQSIAWMVALVIAAHLWMGWSFWRRRRVAASDVLDASAAHFSLVDFALIAIVALLFGALALRAEKLWAANRYQGAAPDALQVEVTGQQFQWYFRYPGADAHFGATQPALVDAASGNPLGLDAQDNYAQDDIVSSELVLPAGREVDLRLRSLDVVHGFFIPAMRLKQNAVPGSEFHVHFTPQSSGTYNIACSQVCGTGHYRMGAKLRVVSPEEFAAWLASQKPALGGKP